MAKYKKKKPVTVEELRQKINEGLEAIYNEKSFKEVLKVMAKFHRYSFGNTMLILRQRPDADYVAGYVSWQNNFKRQVLKGEQGIAIIAPRINKVIKEIIPKDEKGNPILNQDGKIEPVRKEITIPYFSVVHVYDISQTSGRSLPMPKPLKELVGNIGESKIILDALKAQTDYTLAFEPMDERYGYCNHLEKKIAVKEGLSELHTIKTVIHETAHALLHSDSQQPKKIKELEAEAVAYVTCEHFELDTSTYSFGYLANWLQGKKVDEFEESLVFIQKTSSKLIDAIETSLALDKKKNHPLEMTMEGGL